MPPVSSLIEVLERAAATERGITFILSAAQSTSLSYAELHRRAGMALHALQNKGLKEGNELVMQIDNAEHFLVIFWACVMGKIIPVPLAIGTQDEHSKKLSLVWERLNDPWLVTDQVISDPPVPGKTMYASELLALGPIATVVKVVADDTGYIQFSSGSTGYPKGVLLTHGNLVANITDIIKRSGTRENDRSLSWLPLTHDMGLICFHLSSMIAGIDQYLINTNLFIKRPLLWLDKASEYQVTQLYSPNFGFQYLLSAVDNAATPPSWNLAAIRIIYNGAEPISRQISFSFLERMKEYGLPANAMFPGYGLAEACVAVTLPDPGDPLLFIGIDRKKMQIGDAVREIDDKPGKSVIYFAKVGYPLSSTKLRICDENDQALAAGHIGHIQISGNNVTSGYYNDSAATGKVIAPGGWLRTGDIGFLSGKYLVVTGRAKNIIIINGQNYYPHDIEQCAHLVPPVKPGGVIACGADNAEKGTQELIVFVQYRRSVNEFSKLLQSLREKIVAGAGVYADKIIAVKSIPKTTSGKLQHHKLLQEYYKGTYDEQIRELYSLQTNPAGDSNAESLTESIVGIVHSLFSDKNIGIDTDFFDAGLSSLRANQLAVHIQKAGYPVTARDIYSHSSITRLIRFLGELKPDTYKPVKKAPVGIDYPLSYGQKKLWLLEQLEPGNCAAHLQFVKVVNGPIHFSSFSSSVLELLNRHESLRTVFVELEGEPMQRVLELGDDFPVMSYHDLRKDADPLLSAYGLSLESASTPFDLGAGPLLRVSLLRTGEEEYYFIFTIHHLICDGWSIDIISKELRALYRAFSRGESSPLAAPVLQYRDYINWYYEQLGEERSSASRAWWLSRLSGELPPLQLPLSYNRTAVRSLRGHTLEYELDESLAASLRQLSRSSGVTLFTTLLGIVSVVLNRYSGQEEMIISTDSAGRNHSDLEGQVGYFLQLLPVRVQVSEEESFTALLNRTGAELLEAYAHQSYPVESLLEEVPSLQQSSLYDMLVLFQNFDNAVGFDHLLEGAEMETEETDNGTSFNDLLVEFRERGERLRLKLRYNSDLFSKEQMDRFAGHINNIAEQVSVDGEQSISSLELLTAAEKKELHKWNGAHRAASLLTVTEQFEKRVSENPGATAVVCEERRLSYAALNERANRVAHLLLSVHSMEKGELVALRMQRTEEMIISMLGVLKAGGAYVPVDAEYPADRVQYMLEDSGARLLLTDMEASKAIHAEVLQVKELPTGLPVSDPGINILADDQAYLMYTSGSTGRPKGVEILHGSVADYVKSFTDYFNVSAEDVVIQQSSLSFDTSVEEIFPVLCAGGRLVIATGGGRDTEALLELVKQEQVTLLSTTPLVIQELNRQGEQLEGLHHLVSGGDVLQPHHISNIPSTVSVYNTYGPTESTVCISYHKVTGREDAALIGRPLPNREVYILDAEKRLCAVGVKGELYVGGQGVARGYKNLEELTGERFIKNPFGEGRIYRTGDVARWREDGQLEYGGRSDEQVKLRGYRVEPGEIEEVLQETEGISTAAVVCRHTERSSYLVAFYSGPQRIDPQVVRQGVRSKLPEYMVPSYFIYLPEMPVNANGKTDRGRLPVSEEEQQGRMEYKAPGTAEEKLLAEIWSEVLGVTGIGLQDNFFELGGHSLKAVQVLSRLYKRASVKLELRDLFANPTLGELSRQVQESNSGVYEPIPKATQQLYYPLSHAQKRLWVLEQFYQGRSPFALSWLCRIDDKKEIFHLSSFSSSVLELLSRHESLRTIFVEQEGEPMQRVLEAGEDFGVMSYHDLRRDADPMLSAYGLSLESASTPFDLGAGPLLRVSLLRTGEEEYYFIFTIHHLICDGWSIDIISKELRALYRAFSRGESSPLAAPVLQYRDYINWYYEQLGEERSSASRAWWLSRLSGELPPLQLPLSYNRTAVRSLRGHTLEYELDESLAASLRQLSRSSGVTLFTTLLGIVSVVLNRYSGQEEMIISTDSAGRNHSDLEGQVGYFLQLLPVRVQVSEEESFTALLNRTGAELLEAYAHQSYPVESLLEELPSLQQSSLYDMLVLFQNFDNAVGFDHLLEGAEMETEETDNGTSFNDLLVEFRERGERLRLKLRYNSDLFSKEQMDRFAGHINNIAEQVSVDGEQSISSLELLTAAEKKELHKWNGAHRAASLLTVTEQFEKRVSENPGATAVVCEERRLSYAALNERANRVAHLLLSVHSMEKGELVALRMQRTEEMIISMLGVLKAGGAYVPVDAEYPADRVQYMLEDSGARLLLTDMEASKAIHAEVLQVKELPTGLPVSDPGINILADDQAYLMYTSGSTGRPKGVEILHGSVADYVKSFTDYFNVSAEDVVIQQSSLSFDTSVEEIFPVLCAGGRLVIATGGGRDTEALLELVKQEQVTLLSTTPLVIQELNRQGEQLEGLHHLVSGGDVLQPHHISNIPSTVSVYNTYGPTESTVCISYHKVTGREDAALIGRPLPNREVYILDAEKRLCAVGVKGELYVGGQGVARGYKNLEELTGERFIKNPFGEGRIYRTGDVARWREDGQLEYAGRSDDQVKLRGYRVEPGEIEEVLQETEGISTAAVVCRHTERSSYLVAFYSGPQRIDPQVVRQQVRSKLPEYMVPSYFIYLPEMPLNANGKTDRSRLPVSEEEQQGRMEYKAPGTAEEKLMAEIWSEVLGVTGIGLQDNFFELGGHSLKAVQVLSRLYKRASVKLELRDLFANPTLGELSGQVREASRGVYEPIPKMQPQPYYPLSHAQKRLWVLEQFEEIKSAYTLVISYLLKGKLDTVALSAGLRYLVDRHESLRTSFVFENGEPRQVVLAASEITLPLEIISIQDIEQSGETLLGAASKWSGKPINITDAPLFRVLIITGHNGEHYFVLNIHHIISDEWSIRIMFREWMELYEKLLENKLPSLTPLSIQYNDFVAWQEKALQNDNYNEHRQYWLNCFSGDIPVLELVTDEVRPPVKTYHGAAMRHTLSKDASVAFAQMCQGKNSTTFIGLLAVLKLLLYRYTGQEDIIIGTPEAGRHHPDLEGQLGFFVNTLAIRTRFNGENSFDDLLSSVRETVLAAFHNQEYPFDLLVGELNTSRNLSRSPLFDILFVHRNAENVITRKELAGGLTVEEFVLPCSVSKYDMTILSLETTGGLVLEIEYNTDLFREERIRRLLGHFENLVNAVVNDTSQPLYKYAYIGKEEKHLLQDIFNNTELFYPSQTTLVALFEEQVAQYPLATALICDDKEISYQELNKKANQLAHFLRNDTGLLPDQLAGLLLERNENLVISILGILKAGGAYVPMDKSYPDDRINYIIADANLKVLITDQSGHQDKLMTVDPSDPLLSSLPDNNPDPVLSSGNIAYVIYTSGSTGKPKGVMVEHKSVINIFSGYTSQLGFSSADKMLAVTTAVFDISVMELLLPLVTGATLILASGSGNTDPATLAALATKYKPTVMQATPGLWNLLVENGWPSQPQLQVVTAGEALSATLSNKLLDLSGEVWNMYGPTEATIYTTYGRMARNKQITIGKPVSNTRIYLLDKYGEPVSVGIPGRLYIAGDALSRGYLNREELNKEKFISFTTIPEKRVYDSGDICSWTEDGELLYHGRSDSQIKVRGYRIELGEIEQCLLTHPSINEVTVQSTSIHSDTYLVAYYAASETLTADLLRTFLRNGLPAYMIPTYFRQLEVLPRNVNGKVDRKLLPPVEVIAAATMIAPRNEGEAQLLLIWKELLHNGEIGIEDNFFELGGHSLVAIVLLSRIYSSFAVKMELKDVFYYPTIAALHEKIELIKWASTNRYSTTGIDSVNEIII